MDLANLGEVVLLALHRHLPIIMQPQMNFRLQAGFAFMAFGNDGIHLHSNGARTH
jgi:hypothetical protein